jgi:hypothetical protein
VVSDWASGRFRDWLKLYQSKMQIQDEEYTSESSARELTEPWLNNEDLKPQYHTNKEKSYDLTLCCLSFWPSNLCQFLFFWIFLPPIFLFLVFFIGSIPIWRLADPVGSFVMPKSFSEERAYVFMETLSKSFPERYVGLPQNLDTSDWIRNTLLTTAAHISNPNLRVEIEFFYWTVSPFSNQRNVMARISDINGMVDTPSVMYSTHFDTPPLSAGAIDAGMMVATLLEIYKNVLSEHTPPKNPIIIAFVNGEEAGLYGSQGLMRNETYWMKNVARFINLDSTGGNGKVIMYRANPSSIVAEYAGVPYPHANVIGDDIMPFLPSDTDFTPYTRNKSFALNGMDFSLYQNGYAYHTRLDQPGLLSKGTIQENGENLMYMLKKWAYDQTGFPELTKTRYVYYDFVGIYINYSETVAIAVNVVFMFLLVVLPFLSCVMETGVNFLKKKWLPGKKICFDRFLVPHLYLLGYMASLGMAIGFSVLMGALTGGLFPLSWYSYSVFAYFLYGMPAILGLLIGQALTFHTIFWLYRRIKGFSKRDSFVGQYTKEKYLGMMHFYFILIVIITVTQQRLGYVLCVATMFLLMSFLLTSLVEWGFKIFMGMMTTKFRAFRKTILILEMIQGEVWSFMPFLCGIAPCILIFDLVNRILLLLIPILISVVFCSIFSFLLPYFSRGSNYGKMLVFLVVGVVLCLFLATAIDPYSPITPKRYAYSTNFWQGVNISSSGEFSISDESIWASVVSLDTRPAKYLFDKYPNKKDSRIQNLICTTNQCTFNTTINMEFPSIQMKTSADLLGTKFTFFFGTVPVSHSMIQFVKPNFAVNVDIPDTFVDDNSTIYLRYDGKAYTEMVGSLVVPPGAEVRFRFFLNYITTDYTPVMMDLIGNVTNAVYGPVRFRVTNFEYHFRLTG